MAPDPQRTQEQSIKARKHQLFDVDEPSGASTGPRRSFQDCLKSTPADPLSTPLKALLWILGTVVILLLIAALATGGRKKPAPKPVAGFVPHSAGGFARPPGLARVALRKTNPTDRPADRPDEMRGLIWRPGREEKRTQSRPRPGRG